jgi:hypothetical protein
MNFGGPGRASFRSLKLGAGENRLNSKFCRAHLSSSPAPLALPRRHSAAHMPSLASLRRQGTAHLRCSSAWPRAPLLLAYLTVAASCSLLISSPLLLAQHSSLPIFASELAESPLLSSELTIEPRMPCVPGHRLSCLLPLLADCCLLGMAMRCTLCCSMPCAAACLPCATAVWPWVLVVEQQEWSCRSRTCSPAHHRSAVCTAPFPDSKEQMVASVAVPRPESAPRATPQAAVTADGVFFAFAVARTQ